MKLIIVESPTKAKTLSRFLGNDYQILASMGHVRDLPKKRLGVDVENNFKPEYELVTGKGTIVKNLQDSAKKAKQIILATDPDREGEAIAWHISFIIHNSKFKIQNFSRIIFHEITKDAVEEALKNPGKINKKLVEAQQARRILDRLVGYKLSPLLWQKVRRGLSAGRVQSVALRLIVEREKEVAKFEKKEYWTVETELAPAGSSAAMQTYPPFSAFLFSKNGDKYELKQTVQLFAGPYTYQLSTIINQQSCRQIESDLKKQDFIVDKIEEKETLRQPPPPFTTSTLQQTASRLFGWSSKQTMNLAQRLYERGYITYHRTDSLNLSSQAVNSFRSYIKENFSTTYLPAEPKFFKTHSKNAQEAHEAIRVTNIYKKPETKSRKMEANELKLYELIWKRSLATQMPSAKLFQTSIDIKAGPYLLRANGLRTMFDGWMKLYSKRPAENILPKLSQGDKLKLVKVLSQQNFTSPPPRYNEAALIKILEAKGIGRPSTYAPIISLIQTRGYVEKKEGVFRPTAVGEAVIKFLTIDFKEIVGIPFTAEMEEDLDAIARGEKDWAPVLKSFYEPFEKKLKNSQKNGKRVKIKVEKTGKKCPKCQKGEQVVRTGRFGKFLSCSRFPDCDWKATLQEKIPQMKCPKCKKGDVVLRRTKKGKSFFGCSRWPECRWASWKKPGKTSKSKK
jgi:DNA topoisomerase-1